VLKDYIVIEGKCFHAGCIMKQCVVCSLDIEDDFYEVENELVVHPECLEKYDPEQHKSIQQPPVQKEESK
jgi:hypothetical protein